MANRVSVPSHQYCVICGMHHDCDHMVQTKRKTLVFFSTECFEKEVANGKSKRSSEGQTD